jgi:hypothetical protein
MAIDLISAKVGAIAQPDNEPLEELVFQRFQNAFSVVLQIPTEQIQHTSKLRTLLPKKKPKDHGLNKIQNYAVCGLAV